MTLLGGTNFFSTSSTDGGTAQIFNLNVGSDNTAYTNKAEAENLFEKVALTLYLNEGYYQPGSVQAISDTDLTTATGGTAFSCAVGTNLIECDYDVYNNWGFTPAYIGGYSSIDTSAL